MISYRAFIFLPKYKPGMLLSKDGEKWLINFVKDGKYYLAQPNYINSYIDLIPHKILTANELSDYKIIETINFKYPIGTKLKDNYYIYAYEIGDSSTNKYYGLRKEKEYGESYQHEWSCHTELEGAVERAYIK